MTKDQIFEVKEIYMASIKKDLDAMSHKTRGSLKHELEAILIGLVLSACGGIVSVATSESPDGGNAPTVNVATPDAGCVETDRLLCQHPKERK